jgi:leucyl aminopeptidase (aminopeptidase T)
MYDLKKLIKDVFNSRDETFILLNDFPGSESKINEGYIERKEMIKEWEKALKAMKLNVEPVIYYEPTNSHGAPLPDKAMQNRKQIDLNKILDSLGDKNIVVAITTFSSTGPLQTRATKQKFRAATMPGATMDMSAFEADYKLVAKKAHILAQKLTEAQAATVTFSSGHEAYFDLRDSKGHADDGVCQKPGQLINLPSGEAFITPKDVKGSKTHGFLPVQYDKHIVVYEVQENRIVDVISESPKSREMQQFFKEDPARGNIAELGLGCNEKATFINQILQDEKIEGMHWAYGYNKYMGGSVDVTDFKDPSQAVHLDNIYTKESPIKIKNLSLIYPDGTKEVILENSRYSFNIKKLFTT